MKVPVYKLQVVRDGNVDYRVNRRSKLYGTTDGKEMAKQVALDLQHEPVEHFLAIGMDTKSVPIGKVTISIGLLDCTLIRPREFFSPFFVEGMKMNAASIIAVHNHPSGDLTPSSADIDVTKRLFEVGGLLGLPLMDHIIVGMSIEGEWNAFSIREEMPYLFVKS